MRAQESARARYSGWNPLRTGLHWWTRTGVHWRGEWNGSHYHARIVGGFYRCTPFGGEAP